MEISTSQAYSVSFLPSSIDEEIAQNIRMILSTWQTSVPCFRGFGLQADYLDAPIDQAKLRSVIDITKQINLYEPRVTIESINFESDPLSGKLKPIVRVSINE